MPHPTVAPLLKAYDHAEAAFSHTSGISYQLILTLESLSETETETHEAVAQLRARAQQASKTVEDLQLNISQLINQLKAS